MNIIGVQLVLMCFALFMVYVLYLHLKKRNISRLVFSIWFLVWTVFSIFTLFPKLLEPLINDLFIVRVMDLGMIGAFMVLTYLTVESNIRINKYEKQLEVLVREFSKNNNGNKKTKK